MKENYEINDLLERKQELIEQLESFIYGSVEVRENHHQKNLYVHFRKDGKLLSKYIGVYSDELYNLLVNNNIKSKEIKSELKELEKKLNKLEKRTRKSKTKQLEQFQYN